MAYMIILFLVAFFVIGIGITQLRQKDTPVGFYSGEKHFSKDEIQDVYAWNKKHGRMWVIYGVLILLGTLCAEYIGFESPFCLLPISLGLVVPVFWMIHTHNRLIKQYKKQM